MGRHESYSPTFASLTDKLVARYRQLVNGAEHVTLVFDKGNNSRDNLDAVADSLYHFIGSLVPTQHTELLDIPMRRFHSLEQEGYPGVRVYRTKKQVFGVERTVLVTYNDNLFTRSICLRPQHHWTDQKIEVHVFYCVIALMLCSLLRRELHRRGFDCSIPRILEQFAGIREVGVVYPPQRDTAAPILKMTCSAMSEQQRAMYDALELGRYRAP